MLDGLPGTTAPPRRSSVRSAILVIAVALVALAVVAVLGVVFGVFSGLATGQDDASSLASASASAQAAAEAAAAGALEPAPKLSCPGGTTGGPVAPAAGATGEDTPLAATQAWLSALPHSDEYVETREFAAPTGAPAGARVIGWYDHDGTLRALATVDPVRNGGWLLAATSVCA